MSASVLNTLKKIPVPLFGTAATAFKFGSKKVSSAPRYAQWVAPVVAGGLWFVWPAVDEEWKQSIGLGSSSAAPEAKSAPEKKEEPVVLSAEAKEKIEKAYVVETEELSDDEKAVLKAVGKGDFSALEKDWDSFQEKASIPGDGDDDDDEDEEDEDEDEDDDGAEEEGEDDDDEEE
mmetsp:Transcript_2929/g.5492  ORF Transcript_2929/g.5492 Transcript_2929/m.5492 type:complete len:176 (+) Transcript_2929:77-604(+)